MSLKSDLIAALNDFESRVPEIRLSGAAQAGSLLRRNSLTWPEVIAESVDAQVRDKLLTCLASMSTGSKDDQLSAINTAQRLLRAVKTSWEAVLQPPRPKAGPALRASKIVRYVTTCLKHGGRFYTVARRIDDFTLERCGVEAFTQKAGSTASGGEVLADFEGTLRDASDWPGCPFCNSKSWMRHTCRGTSMMFCYGGQQNTTCPICGSNSRPTIKDVVEISTQDVKIGQLSGPASRLGLAGPSSKALPAPKRK